MVVIVRATNQTHRIIPCFFMVFILILLHLCSIQGTSYVSFDKEDISLKNLLASAIRAAELGGFEVIQVHSNGTYANESKGRKSKEEQWISDYIQSSRSSNSQTVGLSENMCPISDLVETAEYQSHCAMIYFLSSAFPNIVIKYEEQYNSCQSVEAPDFDKALKTLEYYDTGYDELVKASDITVWIDPLDASKAFTENLLGHVTTMVCVAIKGVPVIGVIHKPFDAQKTYWGWANHGVSRNLQNNSAPTPPYTGIMLVSRSHLNDILEVGKTLTGLLDNIQIASAHGAGYKSLEVAVKNVTNYLHLGALKKFRICAGAAILTSVEGMMLSMTGQLLENFGSADSMDSEDGLSATWFQHKWFYDRYYKTIEDQFLNKMDAK